MSISDTTTLELGRRIQSGDITTAQAVEASLARIRAIEPSIHAFITVNEEKTMKQAGKVQADIEAGRLKGPLAGVPMAIKDNVCTEEMRATYSSKMPGNFIPTYTVQTVPNLEQAGVVILGKINMDESAMGSTMEIFAFGVTRSPWNPEHVPGGSSGGSCATVATGECFHALGPSTGDSICQPSSSCGITGIKPTYGTVPRYGLIAYSSSLDQIGPVAKDVSDYAAVLKALASHDPRDSTSMERRDCDFTSALPENVRGMRIDISESYLGQGLNQEVKSVVLKVARVLEGEEAVVETFDLKLAEHVIPAHYVIASMGTSSNLSRFDGVKYGYWALEYKGLHSVYKKSRSLGFGSEVKRCIMLGSFTLSSGYYDAYHLEALRIEALIKKELDRAFASYDVILAPTALSTVPRLSQSLEDPLKTCLRDIYIISVNLAGPSGISPPCDLDSKGPPIGLQLIGDCFKEKDIIWAICAYEKTRGWELSFLTAGRAREPSGALTGRAERRGHE